jgi:hypothetical protein
MRVLTCAAARRRLHRFHDEELSISDQIAVSAHLEWCDECAEAFAELRWLRGVLRGATAGRLTLSTEEEERFQRTVVSHAGAAHRASWSVRLRNALDDSHLMYALCGAAVAAVVCVAVTIAMMRFALSAEPQRLAATVRMLATSGSDIPLEPEDPYYVAALGSNQNPVSIGDRMQLPRTLDNEFSTLAVEGPDALFTLAALITREGRVANPELLQTDGVQTAPSGSATKAVEDLMGVVSRARFEPASVAGLPVAVNMVWLVAHTTVRAKVSIDLPVPVPKKRRVLFEAAPPPRAIRV